MRSSSWPSRSGSPRSRTHEVGTFLDRLAQARQRGAGRADGVAAFAQRPDQGGADPLVVLDDQELGHAADASVPDGRSTWTETDP
jgi:hypothetical protein